MYLNSIYKGTGGLYLIIIDPFLLVRVTSCQPQTRKGGHITCFNRNRQENVIAYVSNANRVPPVHSIDVCVNYFFNSIRPGIKYPDG
jgi:hypothetical protein